MSETDTNEFVQRDAAAAPFEEYRGDYPARRRRRVVAVVVAVVAVLVVIAVMFATMNSRIDSLNQKVTTQSQQIRHLQGEVAVVSSSLSAAVACLQTVGSLEGLCTKLIK
jgi:predicted PurR-regulated permease PerM